MKKLAILSGEIFAFTKYLMRNAQRQDELISRKLLLVLAFNVALKRHRNHGIFLFRDFAYISVLSWAIISRSKFSYLHRDMVLFMATIVSGQTVH